MNLSVPVNLRNYFPSESARNFFSVITVGYDFGKNPDDFASVIAAVKEGFAKELTDEKVKGRLNDLCALEHNLLTRMVPLFLKDISLNIANRVSAREITMAFPISVVWICLRKWRLICGSLVYLSAPSGCRSASAPMEIGLPWDFPHLLWILPCSVIFSDS